MDRVFTPLSRYYKTLVPCNGAPNEEKRRPKGATTITTDIVSESFRSD
jgi:hypothetical protein